MASNDKKLKAIVSNFNYLKEQEIIHPDYVEEFEDLISVMNEVSSGSDYQVDVARRDIMTEIVSYSTFDITTGVSTCKSEEQIESIRKFISISAMLVILADTNVQRDTPCFLIISFDGIEHLIKETTHIYDVDIKNIWDSIVDFFEETTEMFMNADDEDDCKNIFVKCLVSARSTTIKMWTESIDVTEEVTIGRLKQIDVTKWYDFKKISEKRRNKIAEILSRENLNSLVTASENLDNICKKVFNDKDSKKRGNSLIEMLREMYDYDMRKLSASLSSSLSRFALKSENGFYELFPELWDIEMYSKEDKENTRPCRYLCRRSILRIIFNKIRSRDDEGNGSKDKNILELLYFVDGENKFMREDYRTLVRRILIYLLHEFKEHDNYISVSEIMINTININDVEEVGKFSELLYHLGSIALYRLKSSWNVLVDIRFNDPKLKSISVEDFKTEIQQISTDLRTGKTLTNTMVSARLTNSGKFFSFVHSHFELFAARCDHNAPPIIFSKNITTIIDTIKGVYEKALGCISAAIELEYKKFSDFLRMYRTNKRYLYVEKSGARTPHAIRIITDHLTYLEHYKWFVNLNTNNNKKIFSVEERDAIFEAIDEFSNRYTGLLYAMYKGDGTNTDLCAEKGGPHLKSRGKTEQEHSYLSCFFDGNHWRHEKREKFLEIWKVNEYKATKK
jgi:hypothetical protein